MRHKLLIFLAVLFGLLAFILTYKQLEAEKAKINGDSEHVVLIRLARDMNEGEEISEADLIRFQTRRNREAQMLSREIPWSDIALVVGRKLATSVNKDQTLQTTDLQQPMTAMLTIAGGTSVVTENLFESRFRFVDELRRMGANVRVVDRVAIVEGVNKLVGCPITTTDLRAGAAMIVAGLIAEGTTVIGATQFIRRGYENIDVKLRQLGAKVEWISRETGNY